MRKRTLISRNVRLNRDAVRSIGRPASSRFALALLLLAAGCSRSSQSPRALAEDLEKTLGLYLEQAMIWEAQGALPPGVSNFVEQLGMTLERVSDLNSAEVASGELVLLMDDAVLDLKPHRTGEKLRSIDEARRSLSEYEPWTRCRSALERLAAHPTWVAPISEPLGELDQVLHRLT